MKTLKTSLLFIAIAITGFSLCYLKGDRLRERNESIRVLLKVNDGILPNDKYHITRNEVKSEELNELLKKFKVVTLTSVFKNRFDQNGMLKENLGEDKKLVEEWFRIMVKSSENASKLIASLNQIDIIKYSGIEKELTIIPYVEPDDPDYNLQWYLDGDGTTVPDISIESAWDINRGRNDVIISVLDGGVDYIHPDLDPGNRSRIIMGYDAGENDNDPLDDLPDFVGGLGFAGHGTNVAGVIGGITDNNLGISGIMWNCQIMPVKMVGDGPGALQGPLVFARSNFNWDFTTTALPGDVANAIDYAINNNADIINLSYGFPDMGFPINDVALRVPLLLDMIQSAYYNNNIVIVAAMGNEFEEGNPRTYPAAFTHEVIAVGATDFTGIKADFSNTGNYIDVSAPGENIRTTERGGGYRFVNGTSFSSPIVSGVAGLIISQGRDRGFNLTNDDVRHI